MNRTITLLPLLLLAGCGSGSEGDTGDKVDPVAQVRTAAVTVGATAEQTTVYGTAEAGPGGEHTLIAPVETILGRILAPNGTAVLAGQVVAMLRPSRTTATDLAKTLVDVASTSAAYARARRLRADGLASDADVETARAAAATARATRASLVVGPNGVALRAPIAGIVRGLTAKEGDQIAAGTAVASIAVNGILRGRFGIDPAVAQRVRDGQAIGISAVSGSAHAMASVTGVDTQVDPATRLASVYASIPQGFDIGPGEALRGSLSLTSQANGFTVPYAALLDDGGRSYVFVVKGGVAHERNVLPGSSSGDRIQILKGVVAGDKVVTEGGTALEDRMKVAEQGAAR